MPETSIVIRTFNEEKNVGNLLSAIKEQDYSDYEIILVDSGSTDRTVTIAREHCDQVLQIHSRDFTFGYSINVGCKNSTAEFIVIVSAHALPVGRHWLRALVIPLERRDVAMSYGRHIGAPTTKFSERQDFLRLFGDSASRNERLPYYANNANSAIKRSLWEEHQFDEYLTGLEDIAWARYFVENGYRVVYAPEAEVLHIHEETRRQIYNRYRREALAARRIGLTVPPHGSPRVGDFILNLVRDGAATLPCVSLPTLKEIASFRYHQWRGSRGGWRDDIDIQRERNDLYFSGANQAVVITARHHADLTEVPMPDVKPGDVLIKVVNVGVCRTDLEIYDQELGYYKSGPAQYPIVPGHEFCGEIVQVGANGGGFNVGERVVGECIVPCGLCPRCLTGAPEACGQRREVGVLNLDGAYARFISLPAKHVHRIPDAIDSKAACLVEPLSVVHKGLRRILGRIETGNKRCAVIGAGPIGNLCAQALAGFGSHVRVFDINSRRLELLGKGIETCRELSELDRFSAIIETTGQTGVLKRVLSESRRDSTILLLGLPYGELHYNFESVVTQDKVIVGSVGSSGADFEWALGALPRLDVSPFVETVFPLGDFARAWDLHRTGKHLKILLKISEDKG